jgi:hypothetical protein
VIGTTWKVGDVISFSGSATDPEQVNLPASALSWSVILHHCPSNCHEHPLQAFSGVASGSFPAPDHDYPSYLEVRLTATDSRGVTDTRSVSLFPQTVTLSFQSEPSGLQIVIGSDTAPSPFSRTVIVGSANSVAAPTPQTFNGSGYQFKSWSDGGSAAHTIVAGPSPATFTATFGTGAAFYTVAPCRLADTRDLPGSFGGPALSAGATRTIPVGGFCAIPASAKAVSVNVTVTGSTASGHLTLYPAGGSLPPSSTINYRSGQTRANNAILALGPGAGVSVSCGQTSGTVHVILDVNGYFE